MQYILQKFKSLKAYWKLTDRPLILDWAFLGIIMSFLFICFMYGDILIITSQSITFDNCLFTGRIMNFYKDSYHMFFSQVNSNYTSTYDIPFFIIFGIWDIPLWIANKFFQVDVLNSIPCLLWVKLMLVLFFAASSIVVYKIGIALKLSSNDAKWTVFIFDSSAILLSSLLMIAQADIVSVFFTLLGVLAYIKKKNKLFVLFFAVAITLKLFAFFIFIPLILLKEKKFFRILVYAIAGFSIEGISKLIFSHAPYFKESTSSYSASMFNSLWSSGIPANFSTASIFAILLVAICVLAYIKHDLSEDLLNRYTIYIPLFVYSTFFAFVYTHPYWIIILSPYIAITIFQNKRYLKINLLLDSVYATMFLIISNLEFYWVYSNGMIDFFKVIPTVFGTVNAELRKYSISFYFYNTLRLNRDRLPFLAGFFIACSFAFLALNFPRKSSQLAEQENSLPVERSVIWFRSLVILPFAIIPLICYYWLK